MGENNQALSIVQKIILKNPVSTLFNNLISKIPLLSDLSNYFAQILLKSIPNGWYKLFITFGAAALTYKALSFVRKASIWSSIIINHKINQQKVKTQNIKQKYGDCWIAITGFTEGIGWAFANKLLMLNLKVILIGRNKQKMQKKIKILEERYPNSQIKSIVGDLSKINDIKGICNELEKLSEEIDIGILINNAGLSGIGQFYNNKCTPQIFLDISQTNWTSVVLLNRTMIPIMRKRAQRSAIINISSSTGKFISPLLLTYPASKRMVNVYTEYLQKQNSDKIDILLGMPFGVTTPMLKMIKNHATITPQNCANSMIADLLGGNLITYGGLPHKILGNIFDNLAQIQAANRFQAFWKNVI